MARMEQSKILAEIEGFHATFEFSAERLKELRADRQLSDIPLDDPHWIAQNAHKTKYGQRSGE